MCKTAIELGKILILYFQYTESIFEDERNAELYYARDVKFNLWYNVLILSRLKPISIPSAYTRVVNPRGQKKRKFLRRFYPRRYGDAINFKRTRIFNKFWRSNIFASHSEIV